MLPLIFTLIGILAITATANPVIPGGRVADGEDAQLGQFPYEVSIQKNTAGFIIHYCAGSIISPEYIVSAAHCFVDPAQTDLYTVVAGIVNLSDNNVGEQKRNIDKIVLNSLYPGEEVVAPHDISVAHLSEPLSFTDTIKPINLPQPSQEFTGIATLSGWGQTEQTLLSNTLQFVDAKLLTSEECNAAIEQYLNPGDVNPLSTQYNLCTGALEDYQSFCSGDSGGPLAANNTLIGVISWGLSGCGVTKSPPAVYVRVSEYIDWIQENTE
ncbi:trypsin-1-like [Cylas formicarius]|uniref:trypsin-1-like n=1 Tax=Cylas formicarius TaxID=197179 RepID=UPI00295862C9|nr:trypsin-1-like [Cylas formicarius]